MGSDPLRACLVFQHVVSCPPVQRAHAQAGARGGYNDQMREGSASGVVSDYVAGSETFDAVGSNVPKFERVTRPTVAAHLPRRRQHLGER